MAMRNYQDIVTTGQTDTRADRKAPDKLIPICCYASHATKKEEISSSPMTNAPIPQENKSMRNTTLQPKNSITQRL